MKLHAVYTLASLCLALFSTIPGGRAATVWNGPITNYTQPAPLDQDILTPNVAITRADPLGPGSGTGGIFNPLGGETSFSRGVSPVDTEWAVGELANYSTLTYSDWTTCGQGNPVHFYSQGSNLVVHLISDNIYLSLQFTFLPSGPGFSYNRSTPTLTNQPPMVLVFKKSGNTLDLSWPTAGSRLQTKTNSLTGNWFDVPNSAATNHVVVQIGPNNGSVFYRLASP
jgi:hypothetical protein